MTIVFRARGVGAVSYSGRPGREKMKMHCKKCVRRRKRMKEDEKRGKGETTRKWDDEGGEHP